MKMVYYRDVDYRTCCVLIEQRKIFNKFFGFTGVKESVQ